MSDDSDVLAAGLRELAEHEAPPAGERFEAGLRQALRWSSAVVAPRGAGSWRSDAWLPCSSRSWWPWRCRPAPDSCHRRWVASCVASTRRPATCRRSSRLRRPSGRNLAADWQRERQSPRGARWPPGARRRPNSRSALPCRISGRGAGPTCVPRPRRTPPAPARPRPHRSPRRSHRVPRQRQRRRRVRRRRDQDRA